MLGPMPSTARPPEIMSRSSAQLAVSSGLRTKASATPVPSFRRSLTAAAAASGTKGAP